MTKLVLLHKADSIYEDIPDAVYDFPKAYLGAARQAIGDWIIYYEPVKAGPRGYFAAAKVSDVIEKPGTAGRYLALIEPGTYLEFDRNVPRLRDGRPLESVLAGPNGQVRSGGAVQNAVRRISDNEFETIVRIGLPVDLEDHEKARFRANPDEIAEAPAAFERPVLERLTRRPFRDVVFRRKVREVYDYRCAISGLRLRNGGGRPEVQAAHIRPVEHKGSDSVRNGLALSGTLHWMFDRGLISVADDCATILVSRNKVPSEVVSRLIHPDGKLLSPRDPQFAPHPSNLQWHRENVFGQFIVDDAAQWDALT